MNTVCAVVADDAAANIDDVDVDDFVLNWHTVAAAAAAVVVIFAVRHDDDDADAVVDDMDPPIWIANCLIVYAVHVY